LGQSAAASLRRQTTPEGILLSWSLLALKLVPGKRYVAVAEVKVNGKIHRVRTSKAAAFGAPAGPSTAAGKSDPAGRF
jgi:hypothetical protein